MNLKTYLSTQDADKQLAAVLGVPAPLLSQWKNGKRRIPAERCIDIDKATKGSVACEEMRPDVDWGYLRGTKKRVRK